MAVTDSDPTALVDKAEALIRDNTFLEFRLDYLPRPALAFPRSSGSRNTIPTWSVIATCRRASSGGKFQGSMASQLDILGKASGRRMPAGRYRIAERHSKCKPEQLQRLRSRAALILSYHDFRATKKLEETLEKMVVISR